MSQEFSLLNPNLLQTLEFELFKFKQYGPPTVRLNIPCKFKEHCKYGKYSCMYSHECFCKFQKNNKKCLNSSCTHQHDLPLEFQLAQVFFSEILQFSGAPYSFEASNLAAEHNFLSSSSSQSGKPELSVHATKTGVSFSKAAQNTNMSISVTNLPQPQPMEEHFSAFSPIFNTKSNNGKHLSGQTKSNLRSKPFQLPLKTDKESTSIDRNGQNKAQQITKSSDIHAKSAHHFQGLPPRISASNQSPPPP